MQCGVKHKVYTNVQQQKLQDALKKKQICL